MQYILTEEEYNNLVPKSKYLERNNQLVELQRLFFKETGYICIYDEQDNYEGFYCDKCPLVNFDCGKRKEFSK